MTSKQLQKLLRCCDIQRRTQWEHALLRDRLEAVLEYGPTRANLTHKQELALDSILEGTPRQEEPPNAD